MALSHSSTPLTNFLKVYLPDPGYQPSRFYHGEGLELTYVRTAAMIATLSPGDIGGRIGALGPGSGWRRGSGGFVTPGRRGVRAPELPDNPELSAQITDIGRSVGRWWRRRVRRPILHFANCTYGQGAGVYRGWGGGGRSPLPFQPRGARLRTRTMEINVTPRASFRSWGFSASATLFS
jgi:hypothetical protein